MDKIEYIKVDLRLVDKLGSSTELLLFELLSFMDKKWKKDRYGYIAVDSRYFCEKLGLDRRQLRCCRNKLVSAGLIDYIEGVNQNAKPRYKVL